MLILAPTKKEKKKQKGSQLYTRKRELLFMRRERILTDPNLVELFNWIFKVLNDLGFYKSKSTKFADEDRNVGSLLGISGEMVKRYRTRDGYIPPPELIEKLKHLEKLAKIPVRQTKFRRKRRLKCQQSFKQQQMP
jgi:hypothetical protein